MNWKFWERPVETRSADGYSDALLAAILADADGETTDTNPTATSETCAGLWARAFSMAEVSPSTVTTAALNARVLADMGRDLYDLGESLHLIDVVGGMVQLRRVSSWTVYGDRYQVSIAEPQRIITRWVERSVVCHVQYAPHLHQPWRASGPVTGSGVTAKALSRLESKLSDELGGPVGNLVSVPDVNSSGQLQSDIRALKGNTTLVESTAAGWDQGRMGAPRDDYKPQRIGANPPASLETIRKGLSGHLAAAGGVPVAMLEEGADATSLRESWRIFLHSTIQPVAKIISVELADKLDAPGLSFSFDQLFASDLQGRARSFQSMVGGGLDVEKAAMLSGLMGAE